LKAHHLFCLGLLATAIVAVGCGPAAPPQALSDPLVPACYLLRYTEWGDPPRADGRSMRGARAPVVLQLLGATPAGRPRRVHEARWLLSVDGAVSFPGEWTSDETGIFRVTFGSPPMLFGMSGRFEARTSGLTGEVSTFSDVTGVQQGRSRVHGLRIPCTMPPLATTPDFQGPERPEADSLPAR